MLDLPRSVRLVAWATALLGSRCDIGTAVAAVTRDDEPHDVHVELEVAAEFGLASGCGLGTFLPALGQALGVDAEVRVVLPAPGDPAGLPGPASFNDAALAAGEAVLVGAGRALAFGLVPTVTEFGSAWEPGAMVDWQARPVNRDRGLGVLLPQSVTEADQALRAALNTAVAQLAQLDVARWREDAADRVEAIRDGGLESGLLPPGTPGRCVRVLASAARVRAIVELAIEDDGAAVTGHEAEHRARTLRELDGVSRRAMVAAVNGILEPAD